MLKKIRKAMKIRALRLDILILSERPARLRAEANELQFSVIPKLQRELDTLTGAPVKRVGTPFPAYRGAK